MNSARRLTIGGLTFLLWGTVSLPAPAQSVLREYWLGIAGSTLADLTNHPAYPSSPSGSNYVNSFEAPIDWAENYGTRMRGYVVPPTTGPYTFWISSDDQSALYLSSDESPSTRTEIARVATWTSSRVWEEPRDGNDLVQKSAPVLLEAGQRYYVEAIQKEGGGGDNLAVGWQLPDGTYERPIAGARLAPWEFSTNPPSITAQTTDLDLAEGDRATFRLSVRGAYPMGFQWQRDGVNLLDGTNQTHVIPVVSLPDNGAGFRCVVTNSAGSATSAVATLSVRTDTTAPTVLLLSPAAGSRLSFLAEVQVTFGERVTNVDAADLRIDGDPATNMTGQGAGPYLFRFPPVMEVGTAQVAWAEGHAIHDLASAPNAFAGGAWSYAIDPTLPSGLIRREVWGGIGGVTLGELMAHPTYPHSPSLVTFENLFEAPGQWGDNYGTRMRGYVHAPLSGDYVFYLATDDEGALYLSTDESPSSAVLIASVPTWVGSRVWQETRDGLDAQQRSAPIHLDAGRRYYIEALQKEGGGGDNIAVAWRLPDDTFEGPIPGPRLSHWQNSTKPPGILAEPADANVAEGETAVFRVSASGGEPMSFLWLRDGLALVGERSPTLTLPNLSPSDSGGFVQCIITNFHGAITSRVATLTVHPETVPPVVIQRVPAAGTTGRQLTQLEVIFSEAVSGVEAADLLVNGHAATNVTGILAGPYVFQFPSPPAGAVQFDWASTHGIADLATVPNPFEGGAWTNHLDPAAEIGDLVLNEFLAANQTGLADEEGEVQDWIEIVNRGSNTVDLGGWALSDDAANPGQWVFPPRPLAPGALLVVFASGKDRKLSGTNWLHTNFKLAAAGEYLGLFSPESPRVAISEWTPQYPEQRNDHSFGLDAAGQWRYFPAPTPGAPNGASPIVGVCEPVHFSVERGFFSAPFNVLLSTVTPGAWIRYTTNASEPTDSNGLFYSAPIRITATTLLRAAAFNANHLPSAVGTHTYFYGLTTNLRSLPVLSVVTASNNLWGPAGIIGIGGGHYTNGYWQANTTNDYHNPSKHGLAWERPTSVELIHPRDNSGFQIDCGIRAGGGDYIRPRLTPSSKFSFHLYFRSDYGPGQLEYPFFTNSVVRAFDQLVLRAGMNDPVDPFITDELVRRLYADVGQVSAHGNVVNLFINGQYRGYYNPTERIEEKFCQAWHGGGREWDVITVGSQVQDGDTMAWNRLRGYVAAADLTEPASYLEIERRLDLVNFVDYLLVNIVAGTGDWGWNNWRAGRERAPDGPFRYYVWDAEWALGFYGRTVDINSFSNELAAGSSEMGTLYHKLKQSPEFRLLFADRINKHLFNGGRLMETNIIARFNELKSMMAGVLPNMDTRIPTYWVPGRRAHLNQHFAWEKLWPSLQAPLFNQFGGRVAPGFGLTMTAPSGVIYYTTNGADPRSRFTGAVAPDALAYSSGVPLRLFQTTVVKARALLDTNWSALTETELTLGQLGLPLRITELMFNPVGGDAYEFIELFNAGTTAIDLSGFEFAGVDFRFPQGMQLAAGTTLVLVSDDNPGLFAARYPGVAIGGVYGKRLDNGGERLALLDRADNVVLSVDYDDGNGWPAAADGAGGSLTLLDIHGDPDNPASWKASAAAGGSPGMLETVSLAPPAIRLNELMAENVSAVLNATNYPDWVELFNASTEPVDLGAWSLSDDSDPRKFVIPSGTRLAGGGFLIIWCDSEAEAPGLHAGFALNRSGEAVFLYDAQTNRVDALGFGLQLADYSVGRLEGEGADSRWDLTLPTPGQTNVMAPLASSTNVVINEWMANPLAGDPDWVELFNRDTNHPAALHGLSLGNSVTSDQVRSLSFVGPAGHVVFFCDEKPGVDHLDFTLPASGSRINLYDAAGTLMNQIYNPSQQEGMARGRLPDGGSSLVNFPGKATPGAPNGVNNYPGVSLSEVMARNATSVTNAEGRVADWIELFNPTATNFILAGMSVSVDENEPGQWLFPAGTELGPQSYLLLWGDPEHPPSLSPASVLYLGRALADESGGVYLFDRSRQLVDSVEYGTQIVDASLGKTGNAWKLMATPTPGMTNAAPAYLGLNANLRLNEWMAQPLSGNDWFEIYNLDALPVQLAGTFFSDDPSISGQTKFIPHALSFIAGHGWLKLEADGDAGQGRNHVNFSLDADGETLRIYQSGGNLIDGVDFGLQTAGVSQGRLADGTANMVSFPTTPTPGSMNLADTDLDGLPDVWESACGLNPDLWSDAVADADGDGLSNREEYWSGTDPQDARSFLKLEARLESSGAVRLGFTAVSGKSYSVLYCEQLAAGPWSKLRDFSPPPITRRIEFSEAATPGAGPRFYRLVTPMR